MRVSLLAFVLGVLVTPIAHAAEGDARYALVHGCYALKSDDAGKLVAKTADGYAATAADAGGAEVFRMQASKLGVYLFYGKAKDFMAVSGDAVGIATTPGGDGEWRVDNGDAGTFRIVSLTSNRVLAAADAGDGGRLTTVDAGSAGPSARFSFVKADGCAAFPEVEINVDGAPSTGETPYGEARGLIDLHMHQMAFEFLGGAGHCGKPWSAYGATVALVDCPDHYPNGEAAVMENVLGGYSQPTHDPVGWPTFKDWPRYNSLTHESSYYRWVERAHRTGLRVFVNLLVDNAALCDLQPSKPNGCNEMRTALLELQRMHELENYIDAQSGGPGKGWYRIVKSPFEARRVINEGKLAVIVGIEISALFDCGVYNGVPTCDSKHVAEQLDLVHKLGVRQMELINKFDNGFGGVAGDAGTYGVIVNQGNKKQTGRFWDMRTCETGSDEVSDHTQYTIPGTERDSLLGAGLQAFMPPGAAPVYSEPPHCNAYGLTELGEQLIRGMMKKGMIIDPDHLSVLARRQALSVIEAENYSGVVSSHSWSTPDAYPRIYKLGGIITPYAGGSTGFVKEWRKLKPQRDDRFYWGFGYGADMNGFGNQGGPRENATANPVVYPFKSYDGKQTVHQQRSGERVYDLNKDGVAHYGLYPDWIEDLRKLAGQEIIEDMARGAEAYLQMWERAEGIPNRHCQGDRSTVTRKGIGAVRLKARNEALLRAAGQPDRRIGRRFVWCVRGAKNAKAKLTAVFSPGESVALVASSAPTHRALKIGPGAKASRLKGKAKRISKNLYSAKAGKTGARFVFGLRKGRVRWVGLASRTAAKNAKALRAYAKLASL